MCLVEKGNMFEGSVEHCDYTSTESSKSYDKSQGLPGMGLLGVGSAPEGLSERD